MPTNQPSRMVVVKQEEKEAKLRSFISAALADSASDAPVMLVARSCDSPVMAALAAVFAERGGRLPSLRLALWMTDGSQTCALLDRAERIEIRHMRRAPLQEAHELLIVGSAATWVGDCMRRDPKKRDAFEAHTLDCGETQRLARNAFEHLWRLSEVVLERQPTRQDGRRDVEANAASAAADAVLAGEGATKAGASDPRH